MKIMDKLFWWVVSILAYTIIMIVAVRTEMVTKNTAWWISFGCLLAGSCAVSLYIWLKNKLPQVAEKDHLFTTVKKGRIKLVKIAGKVKGYYANLSDTGQYAERYTGKILRGKDEELEKSFLWKHFGVIWIGFGSSIYEYKFEKTDIVDGKMVKVSSKATSIFLKNSFVVNVEDAEADGMLPLNLTIQLIVETVDSGLSLNYDNWIKLIENQVKSACRDFISTRKIKEITKEQLEGGGELYNCIISLNSGDKGNPGLTTQIGQKIIGVSVIDLSISDDGVKKAIQSKEMADEINAGKIRAAEGDANVIQIMANAKLEAAKKEAEAIETVGNSRNKVLRDTKDFLGAESAARLEATKTMADALKNTGAKAISLGNSGIPFIMGDSDSKNNKGEK